MPEIQLGFPRLWAEIVNPDNADELFRLDLTWLTSNWMCVFGQGCKGIYSDKPDVGCCALGAHFADEEDYERVKPFVEKLTPQDWQNYYAFHENWTEVDEDQEEEDEDGEPAYNLKTVDNEHGCVFHNREGFAGGYGCALHGWALRNGMNPLEVKPDVCWQLPIRREYRNVERADGTEYLEIQIGEYGRDGWGPGGHDFDWYCTSNSDAHVSPDPVYVTYQPELVAMMGQAAYDEMVRMCENFLASPKMPTHPASPAR